MRRFEEFSNHSTSITGDLVARLEKEHRSPLCFYSMFFSHINHGIIERCPSFVLVACETLSTANPL